MKLLIGFLVVAVPVLFMVLVGLAISKRKKWSRGFAKGREFHFIDHKESVPNGS